MSPVHCPLCRHRVSDWMMASGKTEEVCGDVVHKTCMADYQLRLGLNYRFVREKARDAGFDWSVGKYET